MFSAKFRSKTNKITEKIAKELIKLKLTPNTVTFLSLILALITGYVIILNYFLLGGILVIVTGLLDALDGAVARVSGKESKWGGYFDAIVDRYVEGILFIAIAYATGFWLLAFIAFFGSILTSYAKARTAIEIKISNTNWPEILERGERIAILVIGLILFGLYSEPIFGYNILWWILLILAVLTNITGIQRINRAKNFIEKSEKN